MPLRFAEPALISRPLILGDYARHIHLLRLEE
jgi:hypothetical protein